jgi:hypothetical protein
MSPGLLLAIAWRIIAAEYRELMFPVTMSQTYLGIERSLGGTAAKSLTELSYKSTPKYF